MYATKITASWLITNDGLFGFGNWLMTENWDGINSTANAEEMATAFQKNFLASTISIFLKKKLINIFQHIVHTS